MNNTRISFSCNQGPRENLEDFSGAFKMTIPISRELDITFAVVADGVGGNNYGEVASTQAVNNIKSFLAASLAVVTPVSKGSCFAPNSITNLLVDALNTANDAILQQVAEHPIMKGMSTTLVCSLIVDDVLYTAWAGDSRCYLYRGNNIHQLTVDHSTVQQLIDEGLLDSKYAKCHPLSHSITRFLGMEDGFNADVIAYKLCHGDVVVLCSDGLTDVLSNEKIAALIRIYKSGKISFKQLPGQLVQQAIACETTDNVTVLCCEYIADSAAKSKSSNSTLTGAYPAEIAKTLQYLKEFTDV